MYKLITGFALFLRFPPNESLVRSILSSPSSPLSPPPPSKTPFSEVRHFTNHICCFSNCDFFLTAPTPPHGYSCRRLFLPFPRLGGGGRGRENNTISGEVAFRSAAFFFFFNLKKKKGQKTSVLNFSSRTRAAKEISFVFVIYMLSSFEVVIFRG